MKKTFRDPSTNILKAHGYAQANQVGDLVRDEPDDFALEPGKFRWNGTAWVAVPPAEIAATDLALQRSVATNLLSSPDGTLKLLRAAFDVARDEINALRARTPTPILSITRVNAVATATCFAPHGFSNGTVFITGADVAAYNGAKTITVTSPTAFTFAVAGTPATPATGSISAFLSTASVAAPRTFPQFVTAIQARIADGSVD
jgi:hypothetical protein